MRSVVTAVPFDGGDLPGSAAARPAVAERPARPAELARLRSHPGQDAPTPKLPPYLEKGALSNRVQPDLVAEGLKLRPWDDRDVGAVIDAFTDPDIELWNRRRIDNEAEALGWIGQWRQRWDAEHQATLKSALRHADGWHDMHLHAVIR
ncbi:MAG: GNAT family N-acetyltransferase [Nocardioidaceae bacterium]